MICSRSYEASINMNIFAWLFFLIGFHDNAEFSESVRCRCNISWAWVYTPRLQVPTKASLLTDHRRALICQFSCLSFDLKSHLTKVDWWGDMPPITFIVLTQKLITRVPMISIISSNSFRDDVKPWYKGIKEIAEISTLEVEVSRGLNHLVHLPGFSGC